MFEQTNPTPAGMEPAFTIRSIDATDISAINEVIMRAVATWSTSARLIKRMAPLFFVDDADLLEMDIRVAEVIGIVGVCSVMPMPTIGSSQTQRMAQIYGLFVDPLFVGGGIGGALVADAEDRSRGRVDALFCKAQRDSSGFFTQVGYATSTLSEYPHSFVKSLTHSDSLTAGSPHEP